MKSDMSDSGGFLNYQLSVVSYYLFKILKTIQSRTLYKRGAEVKRIHVYKIYLQKVYQGIKEI